MPIEKPVYFVSLRYGKRKPWVLRGVVYDYIDAEKCAFTIAKSHICDVAEPGFPEVLLQERHGSGEDALFLNLAKYYPSVDDPSAVSSFFYQSPSSGVVVS